MQAIDMCKSFDRKVFARERKKKCKLEYFLEGCHKHGKNKTS